MSVLPDDMIEDFANRISSSDNAVPVYDGIEAAIRQYVARSQPRASRLTVAQAVADGFQQITLALMVIANRKAAEVEIFTAWADDQRTKGRPESELMWGACVRELKLTQQPGNA